MSARAEDSAGSDQGIGFPRVYDALLFLLTRGRVRAYRERLLDIAGVAPGDRVLDIGCGTGTQAIAGWRRTQPGGAVEGTDISEKMLAAARRKARRAGLAIPFRQADAARLPFEDGRFDIVMMTTVLHMMAEGQRRSCLDEAARVLRCGGRIVLVDYAGDVGQRTHWSAKHGRHGMFDLDGLREPLRDAGIGDIEGGPLDWLSLHFLLGTKR